MADILKDVISKLNVGLSQKGFNYDFISQYDKAYGSGSFNKLSPTDQGNMLTQWFGTYNSANGSSSTSGSGGLFGGGGKDKTPSPPSIISKLIGGAANVIGGTVDTQITQGPAGGGQYTALSALEGIESVAKNGIISWETLKKVIEGTADQIAGQLKQESELRNEINSSTNLSGELSKKLREDIVEASISSAEFGISMKELGQIFTTLVNKSGKFNLINQETFERAAPTIRAFSESTQEFSNTLAEFEKVGIGANKTIDYINLAGTKSMSLGLSGKRVVSDISSQINKLNEYGFSKGVEGLTRMVQKSLEFKMNLESVYKVAEDVMDPEKALSLSANLQVLGGAIGDLGDPLKLMYDATNNIEGIQDALIGATSSLATYNREQGRFEVSGLNLRRAKQMATDLGISLSELTKGAINSAERTAAATALMSRGLQMSDEDKEFLTNLSHMEGGQMVISIPKSLAEELGKPTQIALDQLDETTAKSILEFQKEMGKMTAEDVAREQLTTTERMARDIEVMAQYFRVQAVKLLGKGSEAIGLKTFTEDLEKSLSSYKDKLTGRNQQSSTDNKSANAVISLDNTLKAAVNPPGLRTHTTDLYPQAEQQFKNVTTLGTKEGSKETTETLKLNVIESKDLNNNYKTTIDKQDNISKVQIENQKQTTESVKNVSTNILSSGKDVQEKLTKDNIVLDTLKKQSTDSVKNDVTNVVTSGKNVQEKLTNENVNTNIVLDTLKKQSTEVFNKSGVMEDLTKTIKTNNLNTTVNNNIDTSTAFKQLFTKEGRDEYVTRYEKGRTDFSDVSNKTENVKNFVQTINSPMEGNPNPINLFNTPTLLAKTEPVTNTINPNINTPKETTPTTGDVAKTENKPSTMVIEHKMNINVPAVADPIARAIFNNPEYTFDNVPDYLKNPKITQYG